MIFRLANRSDDAQLRKLARETVVPGHIRMIYAREPNFFDSLGLHRENHQIVVADADGRIGGIGCRTIQDLYVNGASQAIGYLSGLKLSESVRNGMTLAHGYSYLKRLHGDNKCRAYLTSIIHGNENAKRILTSKRVGLPSYIPMGNYLTYVIPVKREREKNSSSEKLSILRGVEVPKNKILDFLNNQGARRQFFPVFKKDCKQTGILDAIGMDNFFVALRNGQILGTMGVWDQRKQKQHIVAGYSPIFKILRPFLNFGLRLRRHHPLPSAGEQLRYGTAAIICVADDDNNVFEALLKRALSKAGSSGLQQLAVGMHEEDPHCVSLKKYFHILYQSWLYLVSWEDDSVYTSLDKSLVPYLELGTL